MEPLTLSFGRPYSFRLSLARRHARCCCSWFCCCCFAIVLLGAQPYGSCAWGLTTVLLGANRQRPAQPPDHPIMSRQVDPCPDVLTPDKDLLSWLRGERFSEQAAERAASTIEGRVADAVFDTGSQYGGLAQLRGVVGPELTRRMRAEAEAWQNQGVLAPPTSGHAQRGDAHVYTTEDEAAGMGAPVLSYGVALLAAVCAQLSRRRPPQSPEFRPGKAQLACYPGGGEFFWAHEDGFPSSALPADMSEEMRYQISSRIVTAILYLQSGWEESFGGYLRAHRRKPSRSVRDVSPSEQQPDYLDLQPEGGSLLLFRSRDLVHEVLPVYRPRYALTMWFLSSV